ncbi:MAG TPA: sigma 54-interacting transcriptional regulator [Vicinamibacterales bacterium]|nr:sigma 54-interacting transcriptional regulator [Vicinamibacterales bacterium]
MSTNVDAPHPPTGRETHADVDVRFQTLVQSPLRAGLLRFLSAQRDQAFTVESLMQAFARMRLDVENCLRELVAFGVVSHTDAASGRHFGFHQPEPHVAGALLEEFLDQQVSVTQEDRSPAVQRFREMIGRDEKMLVVFEWIRTAAKSDISVLILGPTGSGKEVVARMIHELSPRASHKLQTVNCAALPETLFESEVFGYEKGAFTGAQDRKAGRLELADRGTLFLDEIGDLSLLAQAKMLRALEERRFERLGGNESIAVDFRLVSSTNSLLDQLVRDGRFREDLYYRINAFAIRLPSLRERAIDVPVLAQRFLERHCLANGLAADSKGLAKDALDLLGRYHWPGNIRELESTISRAALSSHGRMIRAADIDLLHAREAGPSDSRGPLESLAQAERAHIVRVLEAVRWNKKQAAEVLEISRGTLYRKILEYGLEAEVR